MSRSALFAGVLCVGIAMVAMPALAQPDPAEARESVEPAPVVAAPVVATPVVAAPVVAPPAAIVAPDLDAVRPAFAPWNAKRLVLELELISQARYASKPGTNLSELRLDRGEVGARIALGPHGAAELRLETVRSASDGGALGIDGNSMVVRIRNAMVAGELTLGPVRVDGAFGFIPDPWIRTLEDGYTLRPISRVGTERLLGWPPADLAAMVRATAGPARLTVAVGNGEGQRFPERNTGKTTTAVAEIVAVNLRTVRLSVAGVGRDGSIGVARIRDRRAGGGATVITPWLRAGAEAVKAWGIGERGEAEGLEVGGWAEGRLGERATVVARGASLGFAAGGRVSTFGGALAVEPWRDAGRGRYQIWLAVDRMTSSGGAMPVLGADAGDATVAMLIVSAVAPFTLD